MHDCFVLKDLMPIHCCAMQGRVDAIQALLFFDTEGSIKRNLEMENEVFNLRKNLSHFELNVTGKHIFCLPKSCECFTFYEHLPNVGPVNTSP